GYLRPEPPPPIVVGGFGPRMAAIAGRHADGFNTQAAHPKLTELVAIARDAHAAAGRDPARFSVSVFAGLREPWLSPDSPAPAPPAPGRAAPRPPSAPPPPPPPAPPRAPAAPCPAAPVPRACERVARANPPRTGSGKPQLQASRSRYSTPGAGFARASDEGAS